MNICESNHIKVAYKGQYKKVIPKRLHYGSHLHKISFTDVLNGLMRFFHNFSYVFFIRDFIRKRISKHQLFSKYRFLLRDGFVEGGSTGETKHAKATGARKRVFFVMTDLLF